MGQGDFAGAVPLLRQAVASWPEDSTDLEYAYALFNLGKSLNQSGSPAEAIPYPREAPQLVQPARRGQEGARARAPERRTGVACRAAWPASS